MSASNNIKNLINLPKKIIKLAIFHTLIFFISVYLNLSFTIIPFRRHSYNSKYFRILAYFASDELQKTEVLIKAVENGDTKKVEQICTSFGHKIDLNTNIDIGQRNLSPIIHLAVLKNSPEMVKKLVKLGANINQKNENNETAMSLLSKFLLESNNSFDDEAVKKCKEMSTILISQGADRNDKNDKDNTLLFEIIGPYSSAIALDMGPLKAAYSSLATVLAQNAEDVTTKNSRFQTALHQAVLKKNTELVKHFLNIAPEAMKIKNEIGQEPLDLPQAYENLEILTSLLETEVNPPLTEDAKKIYWKKAFISAITRGDKKLVKEMAQVFSEKILNTKDNNGGTILHIAARCFKDSNYLNEENYVSIISFLEEQGVSPEEKDKNGQKYKDIMLESIISSNFPQAKQEYLIRNLLKDGAIVSNKTLYIALWNGSKEIISEFIGLESDKYDINLCDKDKDGRTLLHLSSSRKYEELVDFLITKGMKLEDKDNNGQTCGDLFLFSATQVGDIGLVKKSIENYGANINSKDGYGNNALHIAAKQKSMQVIDFLIKKGANVNNQNLEEETPLHVAARNGHWAIIDLLFEKNARGDIQNKFSHTYKEISLIYAVKKGDLKKIKELVESGANINSQCFPENCTILDLARRVNRPEIFEFLNIKAASDQIVKDGTNLLNQSAPLLQNSRNMYNVICRK